MEKNQSNTEQAFGAFISALRKDLEQTFGKLNAEIKDFETKVHEKRLAQLEKDIAELNRREHEDKE